MLKAESVNKTYRRGEIEVRALVDLDLTVHRGELVSVMGPSGSGKTTLLNCLAGLDVIDGGRVLVDGQDLFAMPDHVRTEHRARSMGFVFQAFNLLPIFTAAENVELALLLGGASPRRARRVALERLGQVGLAQRAGHRPGELSGGEQQRVAIARALATEPAIIWADEPTGNLDSHTAQEVFALLRGAVREEGQTVVVVTHDPTIGGAADRMIRVRDGRIIADTARGGDAGDSDWFVEVPGKLFHDAHEPGSVSVPGAEG